MNLDDLVSEIERRLYPEPFSDRVRPQSDVLLTLLRKRIYRKVEWVLANTLAVVQWNPSWDSESLLGTVRMEVSRIMDPAFLGPRVQLYLVVCGSVESWGQHATRTFADSTGFHLTRIAAIHFVDHDNGSTALKKTRWPNRFIDYLAQTVNAVVVIPSGTTGVPAPPPSR